MLLCPLADWLLWTRIVNPAGGVARGPSLRSLGQRGRRLNRGPSLLPHARGRQRQAHCLLAMRTLYLLAGQLTLDLQPPAAGRAGQGQRGDRSRLVRRQRGLLRHLVDFTRTQCAQAFRQAGDNPLGSYATCAWACRMIRPGCLVRPARSASERKDRSFPGVPAGNRCRLRPSGRRPAAGTWICRASRALGHRCVLGDFARVVRSQAGQPALPAKAGNFFATNRRSLLMNLPSSRLLNLASSFGHRSAASAVGVLNDLLQVGVFLISVRYSLCRPLLFFAQ